jgi:methionine biosynthesis protein MetW
VSFPNFGYALTRFQLLCRGRMPQNRLFPYYWYESPNIHLFSIRDFEEYCNGHGYPVHKECHFSARRGGFSRAVRFLPNLYAEYGFFILDGERFQAGSD